MVTRRFTPPAAALLGLLAAGAARAQGTAAAPSPSKHLEFGIVPLVGGDTDVGIGVGQISTLASVDPNVKPYRWAIESAAFISYKPSPASGASSIPYQDYFAQLTFPQLMDGRLRLQFRPSFTKETTQKYYGLGNGSPRPDDDVPTRDFYGRTHPTMAAHARYHLVKPFFVEVGAAYTENRLAVGPMTTLAAQMQAGPPDVREVLGEARSHGVFFAEAALQFDTRENEMAPERGQFHQLKLRLSPAIGPHIPYAYHQVNVTTRWYVTLVPHRLMAAVRLVSDLQFGNPPFYELARFDDTFALGGLNGVRGIPGQRYYGKVKIFSNCELRSQLWHFRFLKKDLILGAVVFFDAGRLWADWRRQPELDGQGWGLKYGTGGGIRLQEGSTFVVRADVAWSPDARPIGGYVGAGHIF